MLRISHELWLEEAKSRCNGRFSQLRFACPSCGYVQTFNDFIAAGCDPETAERRIGFSCVGRHIDGSREAFGDEPGPCNYAGGGLLRVAPIVIEVDGEDRFTFDFADNPLAPETLAKRHRLEHAQRSRQAGPGANS